MAKTPVISLASDHAGFALKQRLIQHLQERGVLVEDLGAHDDQSVDYPDFGYRLADHVAGETDRLGVAICGSGIGISIAANRHPQVRAAQVTSPEAARLAREHNDANVIALGARLIDETGAIACLEAFLDTEFAGGRHARRVAKLSDPAQRLESAGQAAMVARDPEQKE